jgi:hypothetical protein
MWQEWMFQEGLPVLMGGGDWKMVHSGGLDGMGKDSEVRGKSSRR